jgi:hypothetical protein
MARNCTPENCNVMEGKERKKAGCVDVNGKLFMRESLFVIQLP